MEYYCGPDCPPGYAGEQAPPTGLIPDPRYLKVSLRVTSSAEAFDVVLQNRDGHEGDAQAYIRVTAPATLQASRSGIPGGGSCSYNRPAGDTLPGPCPPGTGGYDYHQAGKYTLSGTQTISLQELAPLTIRARKAWYKPGEKVTFDPTAPEGGIASVTWRYAPGDTLPQPAWSPPTGWVCLGLAPCLYAPPAAGRMYAIYSVKGTSIYGAAVSQIVRPGTPPPLTLSATSADVVAGDSVTFTAAAEGAQDLAIQEWTWLPSVAPGQTAACGAGTNPCRTGIHESGTMSVIAVVDGFADTARAAVQVGACGDERDTIIKEYDTYGVNLAPECADFTQSAAAHYFTHEELTVTNPHNWAILRQAFLAPASQGYGIDAWRVEYGAPRIVNSGYRCPHRNNDEGGATNSRHMYGDAADLRVESRGQEEADSLFATARRAEADFYYIGISSLDGQPAWVHADWRHH